MLFYRSSCELQQCTWCDSRERNVWVWVCKRTRRAARFRSVGERKRGEATPSSLSRARGWGRRPRGRGRAPAYTNAAPVAPNGSVLSFIVLSWVDGIGSVRRIACGGPSPLSFLLFCYLQGMASSSPLIHCLQFSSVLLFFFSRFLQLFSSSFVMNYFFGKTKTIY